MSQKEWGNITWILFHTLAEKINENNFHNVKHIFIEFINDTCSNLPCPICASHAIQTLKKANFGLINSKADMIEFLRQFHNIVNLRIDNPTVQKEFVITKYKKAILGQVVLEFNKIYSHKYGNFEVNAFHKSNMRHLYLKRANKFFKLFLKYCN